MLSSVLRSEIANKVSVKIMCAFVSMRKYISKDLLEQKYIKIIIIHSFHDGFIIIDNKTLYYLSVNFKGLGKKRFRTNI